NRPCVRRASRCAMRDAMPALDWDKGAGLLPAIVQDARTQRVLMLGWMNQEALAITRETGLVTFFSRSRQRLWTKGESSGHRLAVVAIRTDCDADTLRVTAEPHGPTCHLGRDSCFADAPGSALADLDRVLASRAATMPEGRYTTRLLAGGIRR